MESLLNTSCRRNMCIIATTRRCEEFDPTGGAAGHPERRGTGVAEPKFEKDLEKLEKIVDSLEEGGLSLDDSLKKFEEGIKLSQRCEKALSSAEKKIEVLTKNAQGDLVAEPMDDENGASSSDEPEDADDEDGEMLF